MATKKTNNESENNQQEMEQFVQEHINSVPRMWKTRFESFTLEEKVARIKQWEQNRKNIAEYKEKSKLENRVKALFEQKKPTTEEVLKVIEFCKTFIDGIKKQEIDNIDEQIQKLMQMKSQLENN